jgi:hypothetical protein
MLRTPICPAGMTIRTTQWPTRRSAPLQRAYPALTTPRDLRPLPRDRARGPRRG